MTGFGVDTIRIMLHNRDEKDMKALQIQRFGIVNIAFHPCSSLAITR